MKLIEAVILFVAGLFQFAIALGSAALTMFLALVQLICAVAYIVVVVVIIGGLVFAVKFIIALAAAVLL